MRRAEVLTLSAVTLVAALSVSGCSSDDALAPPSSQQATPTTAVVPAPTGAPLPAPDALTGVLFRLADTSIPAEQKLGLVQYSSAADVAALGNFGQALRDGGFRALTIQATDLSWATTPGNVSATVTIGTSDDPAKTFTYPMEFTPVRDTWQLTRRTADQLLQLGGAATPTTTG
ncbi:MULTISPECIES: hypothetical protein [unclassified Mycobacterium]|uniref:hypothetical protein n=1 Tax=unclassified Mycobacterium TaxID=2642494 RepID=UPI0029C71520|nr:MULTISPECIES: hypothetical protein [unclassified Mycobacterium]